MYNEPQIPDFLERGSFLCNSNLKKKKGRKSKINLDAQKTTNFKINIENKIEDKDLLIKQLKEENKILKLENAIAKKMSALVQLKDSLTKKNSK
ncbi:hypothetical protein [Mycoplasmopsis fermentans]|uniref:hypothetical protein n=1 Tax=Mycoplasmopsis fermentans TaxID=2115 RepID=UPI0001E33034|nr:hypothetical protein [Mycoplasmopsis fermentans]ADN68836.1 conserved hypothetical protein [Mycoplasmopsis fermentans JER]